MGGSTGAIRAGRAFVELFALRLTQGKTDNSKLVAGLRAAQAKLRAFGTPVRDMGLKFGVSRRWRVRREVSKRNESRLEPRSAARNCEGCRSY